MLDTYSECWNRVILRAPSLSPALAQDFVTNAFRRLAERRRWSWLVKYGQFITPAVYSTGTVDVFRDSDLIIGTGTSWDATMIGRQFRVGLAAPIYTITNVTSPTNLQIDASFGGSTQQGITYSIYQCFYTVPDDFHQFVSLWDPAFNWQLMLNIDQSELNIVDAQRANVSNPYVVSFRDYTTAQVGIVGRPLQVLGNGNVPGASGTFTGPASAVFTIEVTTGGIPGTAEYQWKKGSGSYTTGVVTDGNGDAQELMDGIMVYWPTGLSYTDGDVFIIQATAVPNAGLPRYELWPHQQALKVYPFLYESRPVDISDSGAVIPRYIRGDVLVEMALEDVALWPGPSADKPNPHFNPKLAEYHGNKAENMIRWLETQDDDIWVQDIQYRYPAIAWSMATPLGDARWLQSHAI